MIVIRQNMVKLWLGLLLLVFFCAGLLVNTYPAHSAPMLVFMVNTTFDGVDNNPGDTHCDVSPEPGDQCTLRAAIMEANALTGAHEIQIEPGTYTLMGGADEDDCASGDLDIKSDLTISGADASSTIIDGGGSDRVFHVLSDVVVTFEHLTVRNGFVSNSGGGGIKVADSTVTLNAVQVISNAAEEGGGGGIIISSGGEVDIINSQLTDNRAMTGGGIYTTGVLTIKDSMLSGNIASSLGGGILALATDHLLVDSCTLKDNQAVAGGGLAVADTTANLINTTISGNHVLDNGGGIAVEFNSSLAPDIRLQNVTVAHNRADTDGDGTGTGGGIYVASDTNAQVYFQNTILTNNGRRSGNVYLLNDCHGTLHSEDYNLISTVLSCTIVGTTTHNQTGSSADLEPLQDNGGPTLTHYPGENSPVIDAGDPIGCKDVYGDLLTTDQRGIYRHMDGDGDGTPRCDIGAVEFVRLFDVYLPVLVR